MKKILKNSKTQRKRQFLPKDFFLLLFVFAYQVKKGREKEEMIGRTWGVSFWEKFCFQNWSKEVSTLKGIHLLSTNGRES